MGCSPSGDLFNPTTDNILQGMENMVKEVDDVFLFSDTIEGIAGNLEDMLTRFENNNVNLASKKLQFGTRFCLLVSASTKMVARLIRKRWTLYQTFPGQSPSPK